MVTLKDSIEIKAPPEKVYHQLVEYFQSKNNYQSWHPDHVDIRWTKGRPMEEGSRIYAEETVGGKLIKGKATFVNVVPNRNFGQ
ncbi:SRPBCC family protein [Chloroflexota bacterium]